MFKPKGNVSESTAINIAEEDKKLVNSEFNLNRIAEIQKAWTTGSQVLVRPGRLYIREGSLQKQSRKGQLSRHFFLFNDILIYGTTITKGKYAHQHVLALADMAVTDAADADDGAHGFQVNHQKKSFLVYAPSMTDKASWLSNLKKYIKLASDRDGSDGVDARAVWVPDSKVKLCMCCAEVEFSLMNRKHHCRNCGNVVCSRCSASKAVLNKGRPERVCASCHEKLGAGTASEVPVAGVASTERVGGSKGAVGLSVGTSSSSNSSSSISGSRKASASARDLDDDNDDSSSSSSAESESDGLPSKSAKIAVPAAAPVPMPRSSALKRQPTLTSDEKKMHELSNDERIAIMMMVKEGKLSMDEALARISAGGKSPAKSSTTAAVVVVPDKKPGPARPSPAPEVKEAPARPTSKPTPVLGATKRPVVAGVSEVDDEGDDETAAAVSRVLIKSLPAMPPPPKGVAVGKRRTFKAKEEQPLADSADTVCGEQTSMAQSAHAAVDDHDDAAEHNDVPAVVAAPRANKRRAMKTPVADELPPTADNSTQDAEAPDNDAEVAAARQRRAEREARRKERQQTDAGAGGRDDDGEPADDGDASIEEQQPWPAPPPPDLDIDDQPEESGVSGAAEGDHDAAANEALSTRRTTKRRAFKSPTDA